MNDDLQREARLHEPPPLLGRWSRLYWIVAIVLALDIAGFWLLTRWAA